MLPTAIRRRLTLTIMCALLMTMSLLLTAPLHTAFAQKSSLALERVFTADANGRQKTSFAPGDAIRYDAAITNSSGQPTKAKLVFLTGVRPTTGSPTLTKSGTFTVTPMIRLRGIGGTKSQRQQVLNAWVNALLLALNASQARPDDLFITWFGDYDSDRFDSVMGNYMSFYDSMKADQYTIDFTGGTGCARGVIAYTTSEGRAIWLCKPFWTQPTSGMESKTGTLLHEVTHDVAMTGDYVYGQANCKTLAANDPDKAVNNASNYMYFAMISLFDTTSSRQVKTAKIEDDVLTTASTWT